LIGFTFLVGGGVGGLSTVNIYKRRYIYFEHLSGSTPK